MKWEKREKEYKNIPSLSTVRPLPWWDHLTQPYLGAVAVPKEMCAWRGLYVYVYVSTCPQALGQEALMWSLFINWSWQATL